MPAVQYALEVWPGAADGRRLVARLDAIRKAMTSRLQFSPTWMPAMRPRLRFSFMSPLGQSWPFSLEFSLPLLGGGQPHETTDRMRAFLGWFRQAGQDIESPPLVGNVDAVGQMVHAEPLHGRRVRARHRGGPIGERPGEVEDQ